MEITVSQVQGRKSVTVLQPHGNLDGFTCGGSIAEAQMVHKAGARDILLDLSDTPYITCSGLVTVYNIEVTGFCSGCKVIQARCDQLWATGAGMLANVVDVKAKPRITSVAISTSTADLDSLVDPRFGRAASFVFVDTESEEWNAYPNPALNASGGAGVQAAQFVANHRARSVISGNFGPNAHSTLTAAGIQMFYAPNGAAFTARELLVRYRRGQLKQVTAPTSSGYHSPRGRG